MLHLAQLERLGDLDLHLLDLERLLDVIEGAGLHRLHGRGDRAEGRHQDHGAVGVQRLRRLEHFESGAAAHLQVAHDDVERALVQPLERRVAVRRLVHVVRGFAQCLREAAAE